MRVPRVRMLIATVAAISVAMAGVPAVANATSGTPASSAAAGVMYAPEQYFAGVFFGTGPVAKHLPEVADLRAQAVSDAHTAAELDAVMDDLLAAIDSQHPKFLAGFAKAMTSGDHVAIKTALQDASSVLDSVMSTLHPDWDGGDAAPAACGVALVCAAAVALAVALWIAVAVDLWLVGGDDLQSVDSLLLDRIIDRIAVELAAG